MIDSYKLTYFGSRGLGEPIRLMFAFAGQAYEDERIQLEKWAELKPTTPYGKLPILEINGGKKRLSQSGAIARYLGAKFNLRGKNKWAQAKEDELFDLFKDNWAQIGPYFRVRLRGTFDDEEKLRNELIMPTLQTYFPFYEKVLNKSHSEFMFTFGLSFVDFFLAELFYTASGIVPEIFEEHPKLKQYFERVYELSGVKEHVESRAYRPI